AIDHLRDGLALDGQAGGGRVGDADPRIEQTQIIVDLGHGADGRAGIFRGGLLLDRDRRRQAFDQIDIGLLHQLQELARIGREAFDIAALALGIDGVEGERGFARAGKPRDDHEAVARHVHIDTLEIVLAGAANADVLHENDHSALAKRLAMFPLCSKIKRDMGVLARPCNSNKGAPAWPAASTKSFSSAISAAIRKSARPRTGCGSPTCRSQPRRAGATRTAASARKRPNGTASRSSTTGSSTWSRNI